jgi:hypothetical protein
MTVVAAVGVPCVLPEDPRGRGDVERGSGYPARHVGAPAVPVASPGAAGLRPPAREPRRCRPRVGVGFGGPLAAGGGPRATRHGLPAATEQTEEALAEHASTTRPPGGVGSADADTADRDMSRSPR